MINKKNNQCPECGCKVFSVYDKQGWRISCSHCEYDSKSHPTELGAETYYRKDCECVKLGKSKVSIPIPRGWTKVSDRLPKLHNEYDLWDSRSVEVMLIDGSVLKEDVEYLHRHKKTLVAWRWG